MSTLAFDTEVGGVEEAISQIARVEQAQADAAESQNARFAKTTDQIREEIEFGELRAAAAQRESARQRAASAESAAAARQHAEGLRASESAATAAATSAIAFTTRLQGAASAVTALSSALGEQNATTGLIANIAGTTAQFAQMGNMLGPQGAIVGGIIGAILPAFTALRAAIVETGERNDEWRARLAEIASAQDSATTAIRTSTTAIDEQSEALLTASERMAGFIRSLSRQGLQTQAADSAARIVVLSDQLASVNDQLAQMGGATGADAAMRLFDLQDEAARLRRDIEAMSGDVEAAGTVIDESTAAPRRRGGGARDRASDIDAERNARRAGFAGPVDGIESDAYGMLAAGGDGGDGLISDLASSTGGMDFGGLVKQVDEALDAFDELELAAKDASAAFSSGWVTSLDEVNQAFAESNRTLRAAGQQSISTGRLMERSLVAIGNNIAETIGGTMKGAFESAIGAWLDGSKSFVEAAEDMAKGVIKALVMESIVQTIVELARGVAALAGLATAAQAPGHFAAAAAWAAVGVVAGGVGAATGAFGGAGGDKKADSGGGADSRSMGRDSVREAAMAAPVTINVYPGGLATRGEIASSLMSILGDASRDGHRMPSGLLRGGGS